MIDICLYRARIGTFNIKHIKQGSTLSFEWKLIHTYLMNLLIMSYSLHYKFLVNHPLHILLIVLTTYIQLFSNIHAKSYVLQAVKFYLNMKYYNICRIVNIFHLLNLILLLISSGDVELNPGPLCNFKIAHINACSLFAHSRLDDVDTMLVKYHNFDFIAVTESKLDRTINNDQVKLNGYNIQRKDRNRMGGGVAIYSKNTINTIRRNDLESNINEILWIECHIGGKKLLIATCYRPPGQNLHEITEFLDSLHVSLETALDEDPTSVLLIGDFNDRCRLWNDDHPTSELKNKLVNLTSSLNLHQLIREPTRGNNLLDLLFTSTPNLFLDTGVYPPLPGLDHCIIYGTFKVTYLTSKPYFKHIWKLDECDYINLNEFYHDKFSDYENTFLDMSPHECVNELTGTIIEGMGHHVPHKFIKIRPNDKPWFMPNLRKLFTNCYRLHKKKNKTKREIDITNYVNARRLAKTALKEARRYYYENLNTKIDNPETTSKTFWKLLKSIFEKNNTGIPTLNVDGNQISDDKGKAEALNDFFVSQSTILDDGSQLPPFNYVTDARLDHIIINIQEVKEILLNLETNKATGPDTISNKILKECAESLCGPLTFIFQLSLNLSIYPDQWKEALVRAIFKKIDPSLTKYYRPISLLSCISKVIFNHTYPYLINNGLLSPYNSGFRQNDSAINRIIAMIEELYTGLDNHEEAIFVSLDISKAFDRVWHRGLLYKLRRLGIEGKLLK